MLLLAGYESTAHMLGLGTFALLRHPEQLAALRQNPHLIDTAVEELLRYLTVVQFGLHRTALEDVQLNGQLIKAGQAVTVSLTVANRDSHRFDDPDQLDLSRTPGGQVAFGYGYTSASVSNWPGRKCALRSSPCCADSPPCASRFSRRTCPCATTSSFTVCAVFQSPGIRLPDQGP
uniref:cytochrome P450 n=1 Tax=Streptomyces justiciae TaxID=2780140 RepID=UPI002AD53A8F|nr:cytochrome P450 [Streptomyces justiciae]